MESPVFFVLYGHGVRMILLGALCCTFALVVACASSSPLRKRVRHFINLTNGIEIVPSLLSNGVKEQELNYIRIQSTHCESRNYNGILESLDTTLLMNLARGNICLLYDFGSRGTGTLIGEEDEKYGIPRAYWMGTEWIRHALASIWHLPEAETGRRFVRGYNSANLFDEQILAIPKPLRRKLKYFRPYITTKHLHLYPIYQRTIHDSNKQFHVDTMASSTYTLVTEDNDPVMIDHYVENQFIPNVCPDMRLYRSEDFMGVGRAP